MNIKLTAVLEDMKQTELAAIFGISQSMISHIVKHNPEAIVIFNKDGQMTEIQYTKVVSHKRRDKK